MWRINRNTIAEQLNGVLDHPLYQLQPVHATAGSLSSSGIMVDKNHPMHTLHL